MKFLIHRLRRSLKPDFRFHILERLFYVLERSWVSFLVYTKKVGKSGVGKSTRIISIDLFTASMDNQAMRDDAKQSNSTHSNSKVLVRMESAVSSVTSTQELVEGNSATGYSAISTAGKLRAMISSCSRKLLLAFICLLSIGILTMTMLYVLENHRTEETTATKVTKGLLKFDLNHYHIFVLTYNNLSEFNFPVLSICKSF